MLSFTNYRRVQSTRELTQSERAQAESRAILSGDTDAELVDVLEGEEVRYQGWFSPFGSAVFFVAGTTEVVANAAQHSLDQCVDKDLWLAFGEAYRNASPKIRESIDFSIPAQDVEHDVLGTLVYDDSAEQWRADVPVAGRTVRLWLAGEREPWAHCLNIALSILTRFAQFTEAARAVASAPDAEVVDIGIWKPGHALASLRRPGASAPIEVDVAWD